MNRQQKNADLMTTRRNKAVEDIRTQISAITERVNQTATATKFDWGDIGDLHYVRETLNEIMAFWDMIGER